MRTWLKRLRSRVRRRYAGWRERSAGTSGGQKALPPGPITLELPPGPVPVRVVRLTPSEISVVESLSSGRAPKQIALDQGVALATIRTHIKHAKRKTGARTIRELAALVADPDWPFPPEIVDGEIVSEAPNARAELEPDAAALGDLSSRSLEPAARLTKRQLEVVVLLGEGLRYDAIADALSISTRQVQRHVAAAIEQLGVHNANELVAVTAGWVVDDPHNRH